MTSERWEQLVEKLRAQQWVEAEEHDESDGVFTNVVIAALPSGRFKLEFVMKPKFLGTQTSFTHRAGATVIVKPQYSSDETVTVFTIFRFEGSDWIPMNAADLPFGS